MSFQDKMPKTGSIKEIIDKLDFIKNKNFWSLKDIIKRIKIQVTDWENIFVKDVSVKGLFSKIHKGLLKVNNKKQSIKNRAKKKLWQAPHQRRHTKA